MASVRLEFVSLMCMFCMRVSSAWLAREVSISLIFVGVVLRFSYECAALLPAGWIGGN